MPKSKINSSSKKHTRLNGVKRTFLTYGLALSLMVVIGVGLYILAERSKAAVGDTYSSTVYVDIPGNDQSQCRGSACFKPEVTQVSFYIVAQSCATISSQQARDYCSDISSATILSCQAGVPVTPGDQRLAFGSMSFTAFGPNAGQGVGQMYYDTYVTAGSSCGNTARLGAGNTPNPTVYVGLYPPCSTTLTQSCPAAQGPPSTPPAPSTPVSPGNPPGPRGTGPTGTGPTGSGPSGGSSRGSTATSQSDSQNSVPSSSAQGDQNQTNIEPSPFFDGKQYALGSTATGPFSLARTGSSLFTSWPIIVAGIIGTVAAIGGALYWYMKKRQPNAGRKKRRK